MCSGENCNYKNEISFNILIPFMLAQKYAQINKWMEMRVFFCSNALYFLGIFYIPKKIITDLTPKVILLISWEFN